MMHWTSPYRDPPLPTWDFTVQKPPPVQPSLPVTSGGQDWKPVPTYYRPQRSCGQGYVFTRVCDSVHRGGLQRTPPGPGRHPPSRENPPDRENPPWDQGDTPQDQGEPPQHQGEPPWDQGDTPRDQGDPPGKKTAAYGQ